MAQREQVFIGQPQVFGGARLLPSPSQFFLTGDDKLRLIVANSLPGVGVGLSWRMARLNGEVTVNQQIAIPTSDRQCVRFDYSVGDGSLLNVNAYAVSGTKLIGQTYVIVQLVHGDGAAALVMGTLLTGYITADQSIGFPGTPIGTSLDGPGFLRSIPGTNPAAGAEISEVVPASTRWELVAFHAILTTSAVAGARRPRLVMIEAGTIAQAIVPMPVDVTATLHPNLVWMQGVQAFSFAPTDIVAPLPQNQSLKPNTQIITSTIGMLAGDDYDAPQYVVREWLELS